MNESVRVLGQACGRIGAPLMFVGEAPGRLGADASAIPFHGDRAGGNFERLLGQVGLSRYDVFITNAALCNPRDEKGNNSTPTDSELRNCTGWLQRQIELVDPKIVVTLGARALWALNEIEPHGLELKRAVREASPWFGRTLIPLYHPGSRALIHRSFANQLSDYQFVKEKLLRLHKSQRKDKGRFLKGGIREIARLVLSESEELSYFALHKICYLIEYGYFRKTGQRLTDAYVVRQKDGPYFTDLHLSNLKATFQMMICRKSGDQLHLRLSGRDLFPSGEVSEPPAHVREFVKEVVGQLRAKTDAQLKTAVYLTQPMKKILRDEKKLGANYYNKPIEFIG